MKSLVWAVDPLAHEKGVFKSQFQSVKLFAERAKAEVFPVYVLAPSSLALPNSLVKDQLPRLEAYAESSLKKHFASAGTFAGLHDPVVIVQSKRSHSESARALCEFAGTKPDAAVVLSRSNKSTMERFFLGSFVETIVGMTAVPLLVLTESTLDSIDRVAIPVEFTDACQQALEPMLAQAQSFKVESTFVHIVEEFVDYAFATFDSAINVSELSQRALADAESTLKTWASRYETKPKWVVEQKAGSLAEGILSLAKQLKVDMVFLYRGQTPGARVVKRILRETSIPILLFP